MEGGRFLEGLLTKRTDHSVQVKVPAVKCRYERCNSTKCEEDRPEVSTAKAKRIHAADAETFIAEGNGDKLGVATHASTDRAGAATDQGTTRENNDDIRTNKIRRGQPPLIQDKFLRIRVLTRK